MHKSCVCTLAAVVAYLLPGAGADNATVIVTEYIWRPSTTCGGTVDSAIAYSTAACVDDEAVIYCEKDESGNWQVGIANFANGTNCTAFLFSRAFPSGQCNPGNRSGRLYSYSFVCSTVEPGPPNGSSGAGSKGGQAAVIGGVVAGAIVLAAAAAAGVLYLRGRRAPATEGSGAAAKPDWLGIPLWGRSAAGAAAGGAYEALDVAAGAKQ